jgi:Phage ABA sandwich domain
VTEHEINRLVAEKIMDWEFDPHHDCWITEFGNLTFIDETDSEWNPSTDIQDAWWVTEKFFGVHIDAGNGANEPCVTIRDKVGWMVSYAYAKTVPEAICLAALKAKGVEIK